MSDGVCKVKRATLFAVDGDSFLIKRSRSIGVPRIPFDLGQALQSLRQFASCGIRATQAHRLA